MNDLITPGAGRRAMGIAGVLAACIMLSASFSAVAQDRRPPVAPGQAGQTVQLRSGVIITGEYIVVLRPGVANPGAAAANLAQAHGLTVRHVYRNALKGFSASIPGAAVVALRRDPRVAYVEPDRTVQMFAQTVPTGVQRIFADENPSITIDGYDDHRIDVDVAVIDTGIDLDHPDLDVVGGADSPTRAADRPGREVVTCDEAGAASTDTTSCPS